MSKYKFDSNKHGDLYIMKKDDPNASLMDINRIIVDSEDVPQFLSDLQEFVISSFTNNQEIPTPILDEPPEPEDR